MTMRPYKGDFRPKNAYDHNMFNISWMKKIIKPSLTWNSLKPLRHIRNADIPISIYRRDQTGAKSQTGGVKAGFCSKAYQPGVDPREKNEPMNPALKQAARLMASFTISRSPLSIMASYQGWAI